MEKYKIYKIHFFYTIGILIVTIIGLITVKWSKVPDLVAYITFALTLTSLTLSLLVIIYSVVSNSKLSESIGSLDSVTKDVLNSSVKLGSVTKELAEKVDEIPTYLRNVEEKTDRTNQLIEDLRSKSEIINEPSQSEEIEEKESNNSPSIERFIKTSSFNGKLLMYASNLSYNLKKGFSIDELFEKRKDYVYGYLVAAASFNIIHFSVTNDVYIVTELNEDVSKEIKKSIYDSAKEHDEKKESDLIWNKLIKNIEEYFDKLD